MQKFPSILFSLFLFISTASAQTSASLKGKVLGKADHKPLELATVSVVNSKDSMLISYTVTDKWGNFILRNLPSDKPIKLLISHVGFDVYNKTMTLNKGEIADLGVIFMEQILLKEIFITTVRSPVQISKDTIEFSSEAFKTKPNAVVEELLKKLPGIQVDNDGSITVNGRSVTKILLDGKEFFGQDSKAASRNLTADIVSKVQVFDDREDDPDQLKDASSINKIINLKLKKNIRKSVFGKAYAGAGGDGRYEAGVLASMFRDTLQVSFIGLSNNLNRTAFSGSDLTNIGGFNRISEEYSSKDVPLGGRAGALERVISGGVNINSDYGSKLKLNLMYFFTNTRSESNRTSSSQTFFSDTTFSSQSEAAYQQVLNKHILNGLVVWKPNQTMSIRYAPKFNRNHSDGENSFIKFSENNFKGPLSNYENTYLSNSSQNEFRHSLIFNKKAGKKSSVTLLHTLQLSPGRSDAFDNDSITALNNEIQNVDRKLAVNSASGTSSANADLSFRYLVSKKLTADVVMAGAYTSKKETHFRYQLDPGTNLFGIYLANQSNDLKRVQWEERIRPGFTYQISKNTSAVLGLTGQFQQIRNEFRKTGTIGTQDFFYVLPALKIAGKKFSVNYTKSVSQPSMWDLLPDTIYVNPLYVKIGSGSLIPSKSHTLGANFVNYIPASQIDYEVFLRRTQTYDAIIKPRVSYANGLILQSVKNTSRETAISYGASFGKKFKKVHGVLLSGKTNFSGNYNKSFLEINEDKGWYNTVSGTLKQAFLINFNDKAELSPAYNLNIVKTYYSDLPPSYGKVSVVTQSLESRLFIKGVKKSTLEFTYEFKYNSQALAGLGRTANLAGSSLAIPLAKEQKGVLKLSAFDLFNQNIGVSRLASSNSITDSRDNIILKRYFLVTYLVNFRKAKTA